jgi:hypothetical protein
MKHKTQKDPFHSPAPQVSNVYTGTPPPNLRGFDSAKGGVHTKPVLIEDEHFDSNFSPPPIPDLDFSKKRGK